MNISVHLFYKIKKSYDSLTLLLAVWTGLEPATSAVTGRHSNQLNYQTKKIKMAEIEGFEPPQDVNPLLVFKTSPFSQTWVNLRNK